jgi:hypothetical protein
MTLSDFSWDVCPASHRLCTPHMSAQLCNGAPAVALEFTNTFRQEDKFASMNSWRMRLHDIWKTWVQAPKFPVRSIPQTWLAPLHLDFSGRQEGSMDHRAIPTNWRLELQEVTSPKSSISDPASFQGQGQPVRGDLHTAHSPCKANQTQLKEQSNTSCTPRYI